MRSAGLSLKQRRRSQGRLARYESVRVYRLARILALSKHYLGSQEIAARWLKRPNRALGGSTPLELTDTELGARAVENILGRIAYRAVGPLMSVSNNKRET